MALAETMTTPHVPAGLTCDVIGAQDYGRFCRFLESACGITLGDNKAYLVRSRLGAILKEHSLQSLGQLVDMLERSPVGALRVRVVDAMTTNETLWFRDEHPFEVLKDLVLPELAGARAQALRIWSAACSTGQEPYSISMAVDEFLDRRPGSLPAGVEVLATDISTSALRQARAAVYDELSLGRGLSPERRSRFFQPHESGLLVREAVRRRVGFRDLNLLQNYATLGSFDVVFCRNVLIYFSNDNKRDILSRMARQLRPRGFLFLGASEPLANYSDAFEMVRCGKGMVYRLRG